VEVNSKFDTRAVVLCGGGRSPETPDTWWGLIADLNILRREQSFPCWESNLG